MTQVLNPDDVIERIRQASDRIAHGVRVCSQTYREYLEADRAYDAAFARAYLNSEGPAHERKYAAELATQAERERRDVADAAYRYADRQARALTEELRAMQSVGASVRAMYAVAGTGET